MICCLQYEGNIHRRVRVVLLIRNISVAEARFSWIKTGDEAKIDENLELFILDRIKEIMKVRGFQVAPAELEGCILEVVDVAGLFSQIEAGGEVPKAFVVPTADAIKRIRNDSTIAEQIKASIIKHVADNKVGYKKLVGGVEFVDTIPKTASGKLLRRVLRDRAKAEYLGTRAKL
ncbi:hypothetical protein VNI00_000008 [Paramarasmius palmivorus]|uniref:AMP-binding enzyme C-terminal domain-containing protein n=1 Tax=Paramarasmius palmivorus TaxID=297713 RepID=A0AAW0EEW6_9AGAR